MMKKITKTQITAIILVFALLVGMIPIRDVLAKSSLYSVEDSYSDDEEKQVTLSKGDTYRVSGGEYMAFLDYVDIYIKGAKGSGKYNLFGYTKSGKWKRAEYNEGCDGSYSHGMNTDNGEPIVYYVTCTKEKMVIMVSGKNAKFKKVKKSCLGKYTLKSGNKIEIQAKTSKGAVFFVDGKGGKVRVNLKNKKDVKIIKENYVVTKDKKNVILVVKNPYKTKVNILVPNYVYPSNVTSKKNSDNKVSAKKGVYLSSKKITIIKGKTKTLKVKNTKSKPKWKVISGKKYISIKKKGAKTVNITGKKKGNAKVRATVGKKKLTCKVTVKNASKKNNSQSTEEPSPSPSPAPSEEANEQDVAALKAIIAEQRSRGAKVSEDLSSGEYSWENGRLHSISWDYKKLSGDMDLSRLDALEELYVEDNNLTSLNVSKNHALNTLWCDENPLKNLDVTKNTALTSLDCSSDGLTSLDVSQNKKLTYLSCVDNFLESFDVSQNVALESLSCSDNNFSSLDVSKNTSLTWLLCGSETLKTLDVSGNIALEHLSCGGSNLETLDVSKCVALKELSCSYNQIFNLDLSQNTMLEELECSYNKLVNLDVSKNTALKKIKCYWNELTSLDVSKCTALEELYCYGNRMTVLDVTNNTLLRNLECGNQIINGVITGIDDGITIIGYKPSYDDVWE